MRFCVHFCVLFDVACCFERPLAMRRLRDWVSFRVVTDPLALWEGLGEIRAVAEVDFESEEVKFVQLNSLRVK